MKLIRLYRTFHLGKENILYKDSYEFQEKPSYYLVITGHSRNRQVPKDYIMAFIKPRIDFMGKEVTCSIWCFDYQEKEAEELLEAELIETIKERRESLNKEFENLKALETSLIENPLVTKKIDS